MCHNMSFTVNLKAQSKSDIFVLEPLVIEIVLLIIFGRAKKIASFVDSFVFLYQELVEVEETFLVNALKVQVHGIVTFQYFFKILII
jgi:hypothetical protein